MKALSCPLASGTVYTPGELAAAVVRSMDPEVGLTWLEPCVGDGAFLQAMHEAGVEPRCITGLDIDGTSQPADRYCCGLQRGTDFLAWAKSTKERFDRILANPPYVALSKLPLRLRRTALAIEGPDHERVRLGANYWYAFLCASLQLLKPGGSLAFILPASWDYADYAAPLREKLTDLFDSVEVHRCNKPMFPTVSDGCVVLIARSFGGTRKRFTRYEYESLEHLVQKLPSSSITENNPPKAKGKRLGDIIDLKLGGVTGDASYFLLTERQRQSWELPEEAFVRVLSRARHLEGGHVTLAHWEKLKAHGHRVWLYRPEGVIRNHPAVKKYRRYGSRGGCNRDAYKIRCRKPWDVTPMPKEVHGFMTGMSRHSAWCCLNEMPDLSATNTLYTVTFKQSPTLDERAAWSMVLLTSQVRRSLMALARRYPDGLQKLEPGDLMELRIPEPTRFIGARERYYEASAKLVAGDVSGAARIADSWCDIEALTPLLVG